MAIIGSIRNNLSWIPYKEESLLVASAGISYALGGWMGLAGASAAYFVGKKIYQNCPCPAAIQRIYSRCFEKAQEPPAPAAIAPITNTVSTSKREFKRVKPSFSTLQSLSTQSQSSNAPVESSDRMNIATDLVAKMRQIGLVFAGRRCLDIGTRSGENALAIQRVGGEVVGIDPDDSEFETAIRIGIPRENLHKITLQDYQKEHPNEKFDLATVFLWNIDSEREEFCQALTQIINKDGVVVIGYHDECYHTSPNDLSSLLRKHFSLVRLYEFPHSWNRYMLVCQVPKL